VTQLCTFVKYIIVKYFQIVTYNLY
jgi:hypothetical protein